MRKVWMLLALVLLTSFAAPLHAYARPDTNVSVQVFYDSLAPYGQWISDPHLGYVWLPNVNDDFRPYFTEGHWVMTGNGNTWVSYYPWGWACFHYGRWNYNDYYGWIWIPGYEWSPGWVAWRWGGGLCGWAPLSPGADWAGVSYTCPQDWWVFLHPRYLYKPRYHNIWRNDFMDGPLHTQKILEKTCLVAYTYGSDNAKYYSGPLATEVQQVTHEPVIVYKTTGASVIGPDRITNNVVITYHPPKIKQENSDGTHPIPPYVMDATQQITAPEEVVKNWNTPRPFKLHLQMKNAAWKRHFIRDSPPYYNYPRKQSMEDD